MNQRVLAAAVAIVFALSLPRGVAAKGHGGGHSGGGHSGGGHSGGGHASAGHASGGHASGGQSGSAHSSSGQARSGGGARSGARGQPTAAPAGTAGGGNGRAGGGRPSAGGAVPVATAQGRSGSRSPDGHLIVGTAVPRSASARTIVAFAPTVYAPIFRPHFVGFGFGYGLRHLGYGYGAAYYGLAYDHPLLCDEVIDCYGAPVSGAVGMTPPYEAPLAPPESDVATIVLQVQPASAQIFVDGQFVGTVEDVQSELTVAAGVHRVEFRAPGYDPLVVDVRVDAGRRITYRGTLKPPA